MKRVLVLGGSGFVGTHVCEKLVRAGWQVTVPTRRRNNAQRVMHLPGLTVLDANVRDSLALGQLVRGHDAVVNLVATLQGSQHDFDRLHWNFPMQVAHACRNGGVKSLVHLSALGVNPANPDAAPSMYLRSKGHGEAALLADRGNVALTILRPSVIFGAEDRFLNLFARLQQLAPVVPLAGADARFQPVWVQDVATAVERSLARSAHGQAPLILEAFGPQVFSLRQLVQLAGQWAGVNEGRGRPVVGLPGWAAYLQALAMEMLPGTPLMSRDNLASMQVDNVASGTVPGLDHLGIQTSALEPIASVYLRRQSADQGLIGIRSRYRS